MFGAYISIIGIMARIVYDVFYLLGFGSEGWQDLLHGQLEQDFQIASLSSCQPSSEL